MSGLWFPFNDFLLMPCKYTTILINFIVCKLLVIFVSGQIEHEQVVSLGWIENRCPTKHNLDQKPPFFLIKFIIALTV